MIYHENNNNNVTEQMGVPASRPLLIFKHNPKAGGGSMREVFNEIKPQKIRCDEYHYPRSCAQRIRESLYDDETDDTYVYVTEFTQTTIDERKAGYVISSIREPCSQYVSLWSFGSSGNGVFRKKVLRKPSLYGIAPPFDSPEDVQRFRKWLIHPKVKGLLTQRYRTSYGENPFLVVDCWVRVEHFQTTFLHCLREYEAQGGFVDWESPTLSAMVEEVEGGRRAEYVPKENPLGDPRSQHHSSCDTYFDDDAKDFVENNDFAIFEDFEYDGCCSSGPMDYLEESSMATVDPKIHVGGGLSMDWIREDTLAASLYFATMALAVLFLLRRIVKGRWY